MSAALVFQEALGGTYEVPGAELDARETETGRRQPSLAELSSQRDRKKAKKHKQKP